MECYCDYEWPTVYRKAVHTACKEHRCYECHRTIRPGERYESVFAVWGGKGKVAPTCQHCLALRDFVLAHVPCSCWTHGNMREEVLEDARANGRMKRTGGTVMCGHLRFYVSAALLKRINRRESIAIYGLEMGNFLSVSIHQLRS